MFAKRNRITVVVLKGFLRFSHCYGCEPPASMDDYWRRDPMQHSGVVADKITHEFCCDIFSLLTNTHILRRTIANYDMSFFHYINRYL